MVFDYVNDVYPESKGIKPNWLETNKAKLNAFERGTAKNRTNLSLCSTKD